MTLENEEGKKKIMDMWACMWEKMLQGVTNLSKSAMQRTPEQWLSLKDAEIKKQAKKNMKCLAAALATDLAQHPIEDLPSDFPPEIIGLWRQKKQDGGGDGIDFEAEVVKLKKEVLTLAAATLYVEITKKQEAADKEIWQSQVSGILETCSPSAGVAGAGLAGHSGGLDAVAGQLQDFDRFPGGNTDKKLLVAHQAASLVTRFWKTY